MKKEIDNQLETQELLNKNAGSGINNILNIAYKILGNPLIMNDITYKLLAYSENKVTDDVLWNELIELGTFSHKTVNFFSKEQFIDDVANTDVIAVLKSAKLKYDRVNAKIFNNKNIHIANICVVACYRPFNNNDYKNIELICDALSKELYISKYQDNFEQIVEESFVSNLIDGKPISKTHTKDNLERLYTNLKENIYIAVVDIIEYEKTVTHLAYFRDLFKELQSEFKYFIYLNNIVIVISTDNQILDIKKDLAKLHKFFIRNKLLAGISSNFSNLLELQKYYKEALNALNYGMSDNSNKIFFEYNDYRLEHFLNSVNSDIELSQIHHPAISLIKKYDENHNTMYYTILYTYLLFGGNCNYASKKLNMDYDNFCNQLKKFERVFKIDLNNGNTILNLLITLKMLNYNKE